ncbi:phosphate ABC transporter permease [Enterobacterales bacterium CwR94]|nr:phosphate ABC transporter permease [Enterobacterales bacterium CwR94]
MIKHHIPVHYSDRRRAAWERVTRAIVTASAVSVLMVMMLLFFWLIWVVLPLFSSPAFHSGAHFSLWQPKPAVAIGMEHSLRWGWRIDQQGVGRFIPLNGEPSEPAFALTSAPVVQSAMTAQRDDIALLQQDGALRLVSVTTPREQSPIWGFPLGDNTLPLGLNAVTRMALAKVAERHWTLAAATPQGIALYQLVAGQPAKRFLLPGKTAQRLLLSPDGTTLYSQQDTQLQVWRLNAQGASLRETHTLPRAPTDMQLMGGGLTLLIADEQGITQWFDVPGEQGNRLTSIRTFQGADGQARLIAEPLRRVFATLDQQGKLTLFTSKREGALTHTSVGKAASQLVFAPQGDGMLVERAGRWQFYRIDNPWPDLSWRSLWEKVWYENYPQADWVWQSTAASDNYQAKFSLVPMVTGTLKAAGLALLFATPLALGAAIYTAWFMSPGLRRVVKPGIEMMGALPSVIVGLIAGLWLAPRLEGVLAGVLLLPFMLALTLIGCGWLNHRLPRRWHRRAGREMLVVLPAILLVSALTLWLVPLLDNALWGEPLAERLTGGYEQRNLLIAGVAMGFALVPLIFTLAEDALFSVPSALGQGSLALGATPWQTLLHVVLPGASAGIAAAMMIGFGRAMGETMIVLMATGNTPVTEGGLLHGLRTLSANVAIEMPEAAAGSAHFRVLFLSALVLLIFTLIVNTLAEWVRQHLRRRYQQGVQ